MIHSKTKTCLEEERVCPGNDLDNTRDVCALEGLVSLACRDRGRCIAEVVSNLDLSPIWISREGGSQTAC